ncbi:acyl-CoA dehydrogenase family protein [Planotetraspora kaengkrachanensis]|uniref:Acyl-CoA dehydrogenase n=1 Tax=Planotetraspora kaengkrachanensis TaxID=575193 RepID=A0A8J3Q108_9ACTN|nr:acyl-CoA dehydrogenase family protein [Planotetraspora kaengkrachanensis]GIG84752.1 acyl-CoA dehydrogenase [Planotetraspora kaengkrachanensis]
MDFNVDETQAELRTLASEVLDREAVQARIEAHEKSGLPYDAKTWKAMAQAGLLGVCLPEEAGGAGLGAVEMAVILRETGARVAPVPVLPSLVAALTVSRYGTAAQKEALAPLAEGDAVLTFAFREPGADPGEPPATTAAGGRLTGRASVVSHAASASGILVPAQVEGAGVGLFLVEADAVAVREVTLATGEAGAVITMDGAPGEAVGEADGAAWESLRLHALAGVTATASGVLAGALKLTTDYIRTRRQFDRALAEFQAVTMQIADVYIAGRALDVAMWSGVWRLAEGLPAAEDLAIAAFHTTGPVLEALYTCQHLHGGIGLDVTYPLHRYFAWGKNAAHLLGGTEAQLDLIGALV